MMQTNVHMHGRQKEGARKGSEVDNCIDALYTFAQRRVHVEKELADVPGERAAAQTEQRLKSAIAGLETQLEYKHLDMAATKAKLDRMAADVRVLTQVHCRCQYSQ